MKKILVVLFMLPIFIPLVSPFQQSYADWSLKQSPVKLVDDVKKNANKKKSQEVQNTEYDKVTGKASMCAEIPADGRFTISRTLCNLKSLSRDYIQYIMYIWLTVATILLIRNWFQLVTSSDREKQMSVFKKNLIYIVIWVFLLIGFYYLIDIFVSVVNLILE